MNRIIGYEWISPRIVKIRLKILTFTVTVIGLCAPVEGKTSETEEFYDELQAVPDKSVKVTVSYWQEILMQELVLSQLISALDQRENRPSVIMEES
jgi:hypothetical protein